MSLRFVLNDENSTTVPEKRLAFRFRDRFTNYDSVFTRRKTSLAPRSSHESSKHKSCPDSKRSRQPARSMHAAGTEDRPLRSTKNYNSPVNLGKEA